MPRRRPGPSTARQEEARTLVLVPAMTHLIAGSKRSAPGQLDVPLRRVDSIALGHSGGLATARTGHPPPSPRLGRGSSFSRFVVVVVENPPGRPRRMDRARML